MTSFSAGGTFVGRTSVASHHIATIAIHRMRAIPTRPLEGSHESLHRDHNSHPKRANSEHGDFATLEAQNHTIGERSIRARSSCRTDKHNQALAT